MWALKKQNDAVFYGLAPFTQDIPIQGDPGVQQDKELRLVLKQGLYITRDCLWLTVTLSGNQAASQLVS